MTIFNNLALLMKFSNKTHLKPVTSVVVSHQELLLRRSLVVLGKDSSNKTRFVLNVIEKWMQSQGLCEDDLFIFNETESIHPEYTNAFPNAHIESDLVWTVLEKALAKGRMLVIHGSQLAAQIKLSVLHVDVCKFNGLFVFVADQPASIPTAMKGHVDTMILFEEPIHRLRRRIFDRFAHDIFDTFTDFLTAFGKIKKPDELLVLDFQSKLCSLWFLDTVQMKTMKESLEDTLDEKQKC